MQRGVKKESLLIVRMFKHKMLLSGSVLHQAGRQ
jgi:hypothetical protein